MGGCEMMKRTRTKQYFTVPMTVVARNYDTMYKVDGKHKTIQVSANQEVIGKVLRIDSFQSGFLSIEVELHPWDGIREVRDRIRAKRIAKTEVLRAANASAIEAARAAGCKYIDWGSEKDSYVTSQEAEAYRKYGRSPCEDIMGILEDFPLLPADMNQLCYGTRRTGEMTFPINFTKERTMKVFEAIVLKLDPDFHPRDTTVREPVEIVKVVQPFLAASETAAREAVLIDYAKEANLAGKDLTGYSVVVRSFRA